MCMDAMAGNGEYQLIFIPWFWQEEYRAKVTNTTSDPFVLTTEEQTLKSLHKLDDEQIQWRRNKIPTLANKEFDFKREYPCDPMEAFIGSGETFFSSDVLSKARKANLPTEKHQPVIIGVDCARTTDRIAWTVRQGRKILAFKTIKTKGREVDTEELYNIIRGPLTTYNADKVFVDAAYGHGAVDLFKMNGYGAIVQAINFGSSAVQKDIYLNKRSEMYHMVREHIASGPYQIPDNDDFYSDLMVIPPAVRSTGYKLQIPSKEAIKKEHGKSTDIADSLVLTYAMPVLSKYRNPNDEDNYLPERNIKVVDKSAELSTMRRVQSIFKTTR